MKGIEKTANGWRIIARVRVGGKIVQRRQTVQGATKEQAKALREQIKNRIRAGRTTTRSLTASGPKLFKHIVGIYKNKIRAERGAISPGHEGKIKRLEDTFGESDIIQFPERFERFIAEFRVKGKNHQANRFIEIARAAFQVCIEAGHFKENPITENRFPSFKETARDCFLPAEEISKIILTAAKNKRTFHIARALQYYFSVPCRRGEVVRMKIADIDLFGQRVRVHNGTTKNDEGIWKPIPPAMKKWFTRRVREARGIDNPVFYRVVKGSSRLRTGIEPRIVSIGDFKNAWDTVRAAAGHPTLRIHDSRHIAATDMVNAGTPRTIVNAVAGWKTDMLRTYYHLANDAALSYIQWPEIGKREASVKPQKEQAV